VVNSNIPDVALGWANAFWQIMQFLIISLAFTHAANGLRMIAEDYVGHTLWQPFARAFFALLWLAMIIIAVYVIIGSAY
jgi:succinate dehydrogenase hydrophobic anchor subunit